MCSTFIYSQAPAEIHIHCSTLETSIVMEVNNCGLIHSMHECCKPSRKLKKQRNCICWLCQIFRLACIFLAFLTIHECHSHTFRLKGESWLHLYCSRTWEKVQDFFFLPTSQMFRHAWMLSNHILNSSHFNKSPPWLELYQALQTQTLQSPPP